MSQAGAGGARDGGDEVWTIRRVLTWAADDLRKRGSSSPRLDAELLLGHVLGVDRVGLVIDAERPLAKEELARFRALFVRRRAGEPVAYLLGFREFYGRRFRVDKRVLIPRPDTETLVEVALERTRALDLCARALDLCTGSGCVAISLALERPTTRVLGTDISEEALVVARDNAVRLGAFGVGFLQADLFDGVPDGARFELITANPPYIRDDEGPELAPDIRLYEPHVALFGGADGLAPHRRIVAEAPRYLTPGGVLALEIGSDQAALALPLLSGAGFDDVRCTKDLAGHDRVVAGRWVG